MVQTIELAIDSLFEWLQLEGVFIVLLTLPLAIIQGVFGFFPFATLIVLHLSHLGLIEGLLTIWLVGTLASIVVFMICRYFFAEWFQRKWGYRIGKYEKWVGYFEKYGVWTLIFLRTLPIMPNNIISFMAAISPISFSVYVWSSILGNLSHIWLFGIISSSLVLPDTNVLVLIVPYILFCVTLTIGFIFRNYYRRKWRTTKKMLKG